MKWIVRITTFLVLTMLFFLALSLLLEFLATLIEKHGQQIMMVLLGIVIIAVIVGCGLLWGSIARRSTTHGSARFARLSEVKKAGMLYPFSHRQAHKQQWLAVGRTAGRTIALAERQQQAHILLVAPTRAGKTTTVILPNLLQETGKRNLLIHDMKGELYDLASGYLAEHMTVYKFVPISEYSASYNPLTYVDSQEDAQDVADAIIKNTGSSTEPFWDNAARLILTAAILHVKSVNVDAPLVDIVDLLQLDIAPLQETILQSPSFAAQQIAGAFLTNMVRNERLSGSVMTDVQSRLLSLKSPLLQRITASTSINLDTEQPIALFLTIPPDEAVRLRWLSSCLTMQLMKRLARSIRHTTAWCFYLDELANLGHVPNYLQYISYIGGYGISLVQAIQDHGQLERLYGEDGLSTILSNSSTHIIFPGMGMREASYYSDLIGYTTTLTASTSWQRHSLFKTTPTRSRAEAQRKLLLPDEIRTLPDGELIICSKNRYPLRVKATPYYREKQFRERASIAAPVPARLAERPPAKRVQSAPGGQQQQEQEAMHIPFPSLSDPQAEDAPSPQAENWF